MFFDLSRWLRDGRAAYRSANNVICVYESVSLVYIHNVIDRTASRELHSGHDWEWLKTAVQENRLQVTSNGQWIPNQEAVERITLTPQMQSAVTLA